MNVSGTGEVLRVLMTADAVGGVWTYALELASALAQRGVRTTLAVMGPAPSAAQREAAAAVADIHAGAFALEWAHDPWDDVERAGAWLLELERSTRPDVVHLNGYAHGALPWSAPAVVVAHSCVCSWWRACRGQTAPAAWDRYRAAVRDGLAGAAAIVAPSRAMLSALLAEHDPGAAHAPRSRVIPNAIDPARFTPAESKLPLVLAAGRLWDEAKNVAALDAIAADLPWPVLIAGSTADDEGRAVTFEGSIALGVLEPSALAGWMHRSAVYALPARYEPFGLSVLEAALSGCALVLGDIPSLREHWTGAALFVRPDDHAALRGSLLHLVEDRELREGLGQLALARARSIADRDRFASAYLSLYAELLSSDELRSTACA
jgi:glycogen(starch) synthase